MSVASITPEVSQPMRRDRSPLAVLRYARGWSQRELALAAGVSKRTVASAEMGEFTPRLRTAVAITAALGLEDPRVLFPDAFAPLNDQRPVAVTPGADTTTATGGPLSESYSP
jgi:DNA-binding XRE family transcriptional regulator